MKKVILLLTLFSSLCQAQVKLSDQAEISVITLGPYQGELYSAFGHSALRVYDPVRGIDEAYNYGVFDFDQPNFYLNFARGFLYYKLGLYYYKQFEGYYIYHNRYVHEQKLNFTQYQKQKFFEALQWNARPENQYYRYDYFYNNCATKIPEKLNKVFGDSITFDGSYIKEERTIRELTDLYLQHQPWGDLGIDICLGLPMDKTATPYEHMFLPDYVESGLAHATINQNGNVVPLVKERISIYEPRFEQTPVTVLHPLMVFSAVFIILAWISYRDLRRKKLSNAIDITLLTITGALGVLFLLLWIATDHRAAARNMNLLWALPTHLVAAIAFIKNARWLKNYFLVVGVISILLLVSWPFLPQTLHYALIPLVMGITLRCYVQYAVRKQVQ